MTSEKLRNPSEDEQAQGNDDFPLKREKMETKLYIPEDVNGEPNRQELRIAREVSEELSKYPGFIGLAPFGSVMSGYSNEKSDLDLCILFDQKEAGKDGYLNFWRHSRSICAEKGGDRKVSGTHITNISVEEIIRDIHNFLEKGSQFPGNALEDMTKVFIGKKIDRYRKPIAEELKKMSEEDQTKIADMIVAGLADTDNLSLRKRTERLPEFTQEDHETILKTREEMWKKRVKNIWGIS